MEDVAEVSGGAVGALGPGGGTGYRKERGGRGKGKGGNSEK